MTEANEETLRKVMGLKESDPISEQLVADLDEVERMSARADVHFLSPDVLALVAFQHGQHGICLISGDKEEPMGALLVESIFAFGKGDKVVIDKDDGVPRTGTIIGKGKKAGHYRVNINGDDAAYKELPYEFLSPAPITEILEPVEV